tara:strand:+ start:4986 stop:8990 length:4005 start_codon:yes stop_codon:yes gene_type:complete
MSHYYPFVNENTPEGKETIIGQYADQEAFGVGISSDFNISGVATFLNTVHFTGKVHDKDGQVGSSGQVLSSTGTQVDWVNVGDLAAGAASKVAIETNDEDVTHYIGFVSATSGNHGIRVEDTLSYNPNKNRIRLNGSIGIGTTNPAAPFAIHFDGSEDNRVGGIEFNGNSNSGGDKHGARILAYNRVDVNKGFRRLRFQAHEYQIEGPEVGISTTNAVPILNVTSYGDVGIGTTNPFDSYDGGFRKRFSLVSGGGQVGSAYTWSGGDFYHSEDVLNIMTKAWTGGFNINVREQEEDNPTWTIRTYSSEPLAFAHGIREKARIHSNGFVGIGTTNPLALVHIHHSEPRIFLTDTDTNVQSQIDSNSGAGNLAINIDVNEEKTNSNFIVRFGGTGGTGSDIDADGEKFRITQGGRVGLGTMVPRRTLDVVGKAHLRGTLEFAETLSSYDPYDKDEDHAGSDTSSTAAIALYTGQAIVGTASGYIRELFKWTTGSSITIGQHNTTMIAGIELKPGNATNSAVKLHHKGSGDNIKLVTTDTGVSVTGSVNVTGGFSTSTGTSSQFLKADGSVDSNTYTTNNSFTGLTDTPASFTADMWIKVNSSGNALELTDAPLGGSTGLNGLNDVTITSASNGQVLKYNGSAWVNDTDATGGGGGGISLTDISVGADAAASGGGDLSYNNSTGVFTFTPAETYELARTLGWQPAYGSSVESNVTWSETEHAIDLYNASDASIGAGYKAFRVRPGETYVISLTIKGDVANSNGFYGRIYELDSELPAGKTHVSLHQSNNASNSSAYVQTADAYVYFGSVSATNTTDIENGPITTDWVTHTFEYTVTTGAVWASLVVLNWSGHSTNHLYIKHDPDIKLKGSSLLKADVNDSFQNKLTALVDGISSFTHNGTADSDRTEGTYNHVTGTASASGTDAEFKVVVASDGTPTLYLQNPGRAYKLADTSSFTTGGTQYGPNENETITIADSSVGGGGAANIVVTVTGVNKNGSIHFQLSQNLPWDVDESPYSNSHQSHDFMTFGGAGSLSQISKRGGLMLVTADDTLVLANGDVGDTFKPSKINADAETIQLISDGTVQVRTNWQDLGSDGDYTFTFEQDGKLTAPTGFKKSSNSGGFLKADGTEDTNTYLTTSSIPSGTVMLFYQSAAPTGWTKSTSHNNKALRVVSGSGGGSGGNNTFTTVFSNQSVSGTTGNSVSGSTSSNNSGSVSISGSCSGTQYINGNTTQVSLSTAQLAAHQHAYDVPRGTSGGSYGFLDTMNSGSSGTNDVASAGSGDTHYHAIVNYAISGSNFTFSGSGSPSDHDHDIGNHDHSFSDTVDMRVQYIDVIICSKN